jgi:hypothetical protein
MCTILYIFSFETKKCYASNYVLFIPSLLCNVYILFTFASPIIMIWAYIVQILFISGGTTNLGETSFSF